MKKYSLGLDLGITSVGWALFELQENEDGYLIPTRMEDCGVRIFEGLENQKDGSTLNEERRASRGTRRLIRRRKLRIKTTKQFIKDYFGFECFDFLNNNNPILLKVKGLKEKLTPEELSACLVHYVKHRGFRSNRIHADAKSDEGKLNKVIAANEKVLGENKMMVSEYVADQFTKHGKMHNSGKEYKFTFKRANYKNEIISLLDKQISYKVIDKRFKEVFIDIWSRQRDFSDGPGPAKRRGDIEIEKSPYAFNIEDMLGRCSHIQGEYRAPKNAPSVELFTALQKLQNVRYKTDIGGKYEALPHDIILSCLEFAKEQRVVKYGHLKKMLNVGTLIIKGQDISKKDYVKVLVEFKEKNNIAKNAQIEGKQYDLFKDALDNVKMNDILISLTTYHDLKKGLSSFDSAPIEKLDYIIKCLLVNKTDKKIKDDLIGSEHEFTEKEIEEILKLGNYSTTANVSLKYIYTVYPEMVKGMNLREAEEKHGLEIKISKGKEANWLPPVDQICEELGESMTNKNVLHTLTETRKILNLLIKTYGKPYRINIELGRDLSRSFEKRREVRFAQLDNKTDNERAKFAISRDFGFPIAEIKLKDIIVWRLFKQQDEMCLYSMSKINYKRLYEVGYVEVDHIIPQSRSFDDSFGNKVLVLAKENQNKGNCTPYECFGQNHARWNSFTAFINNSRLPEDKKEKLLLKSLSDEDFMAKNLIDTQYATRTLATILKHYLDVEVNTFAGQMTAKFRAFWGLNGLTHSYESEDYKINRSYLLIEEPIVGAEDITFKFLEISNGTIEIGILGIKITAKKKAENKEDDDVSAAVRLLGKNARPAAAIYQQLIGMTIYSRSDELYAEINKYAGENEVVNAMLTIHQVLRARLNTESEKKNRNNHLHHIIDASVIAAFNKSLEKKIVAYNRKLEQGQKKTRIDELTGEIISYDPNELEALTKFPRPYDNFTKEVKLRVLERKLSYLKEQLRFLGYNEEDIDKVNVIIPSIATNRKVNKKMHKDTFYGMKGDKATQRVSIDKITKDNLEKIYDTSENKLVLNTIMKWLESGKKTEYPILMSKNGVACPIKKVTIIEGDLETKMIIGREETEKAVEISDVVRNDVYKQGISDVLYFVQFNPLTIKKERKFLAALKTEKKEEIAKNDFEVWVWWGQDKNKKSMMYSELVKLYERYIQIFPSEIIEIETNNGRSIAIACGFSSGRFEIKSIIGDDYDLQSEKVVRSLSMRNRITISTIKSIRKLNINALGKMVHGL